MTRRIFFLGALAAPVLAKKNKVVIPAGSKIYIEEMEQGLDDLIRAQIFEKDVDLKVVLSPDQAEYVLLGYASEETQRKWHEGWLTSRKAHASGSVSLIKPGSDEVLWAIETSDKNRWWGAAASEGHRKVAKKIVEGLKDIVK